MLRSHVPVGGISPASTATVYEAGKIGELVPLSTTSWPATARPTADLVTVRGARAATAYGEYVAGEIAGDVSDGDRRLLG
ncbi:hypothetical protein GCM10022220_65230 [Actinocatenispora rupis]